MLNAAQIIIGGLLQGSAFAVVALGFSLVFRVTGVVNLSQGAFCIVGAVAMYFLQVDFGLPLILAAAGSATIGLACGFLFGAVTFVPALSRLPMSAMLMVTAGLLTFMEGLILVVWGNQSYALPPFSGEAPLLIGALRVPSQGFWIAGISAAIVFGLWWLIYRTGFGVALRACAQNPLAARLMGIDLNRVTLVSFALAAAIAAIGGIAIAPLTTLQFDSGRFLTVYGFIAATIGGLGTMAGAIVGGLALGATEQLAAGYLSSLFANALALLILLAMLLWRPRGLFASRHEARADVSVQRRVQRAVVRLEGVGAQAFIAALVVALAALPFLVPAGMMASLTIAMILYIAVLGLDVLMGYSGQISLGQAGFMAIGGYAATILATNYGWPPLAGVLAGMALSLIAALLLAFVTMSLRGDYLALATLAFGLLIDSLAAGLVDITGGPSGLVGIPPFSIGPWALGTPRAMYYLALILAAIFAFALYGGMHSGFGRALQAIRTDPTAAAALGINVPHLKAAAFAIAAMLTSLAGSLFAFDFHFLSPDMVDTPRSFEMVAMLVLGGEGTLVGGLFGTFLLTLLPTVFQPFALYKTMVEGALLIAIFMYLPEGMLGRIAVLLSPRLARRDGDSHDNVRA
jgi:branched-chain amino acid transport system permease protein